MGLKQDYYKKIREKLQKKLKLDSIMAVPRPMKVTLNIGLGEALNDSKIIDAAEEDLMVITGQKPIRNKARKDVSGFGVRKGQVIGTSVTMRGDRMWDFIERYTQAVLPRVRDFYGLSKKSFDGMGNYSIGMKEQVAFPEIDTNKIDKVRSLQVVINTSAKTDEEGYELLKALGFPFLD